MMIIIQHGLFGDWGYNMSKKIFLVLLSLLISVFILNGCVVLEPKNHYPTVLEISEDISAKIVKCFDTKDVDTLKGVFCSKTQSEHNLDDEIKLMFEKYEGKSMSYEVSCAGASGGYKDGEWFDKNITPKIKNWKTDTNKTYIITYFEYLIYDDNQDMIGIVSMSLRDSDGVILSKIGWDEE